MLTPFAFQQIGTVEAFNPSALSGVTHRYVAPASSVTSGLVTSWTDSVGAVNMVQATTGRQPIYVPYAYDFNGQPVIRFSSGTVLASTAVSSIYGGVDRTVFVIAKTNAVGDASFGDNLFATDDAPISQYNANNWPTYQPKAVSTRGIHSWAGTSSFYGEQSASKPTCIVWRQSGTAITFRREQTTLVSSTFSPSGNQGYCVAGKGMQNTGQDADCDIAEIIVYNRALTDAEILQVEGYAYTTYGLGAYGTLPVANPALWLDASRSDSLFVENTFTTAVTTDNGPVGGWKDLSGNNRHALQSGTNRPTWRTPINGQNGLGVMSFNGSTQYFDVANLPSLASGYTFYGVIKQPTATGAVISSASAGVDGSTAALVARPGVTAVGNAQISTSQSKYGGASAYFDGSGDYLDVSGTGIATAFGTGDFTIECWIYPTDSTFGRRILQFSDNNDNLDLNLNGAGSISYYNGSSVTSSSSGIISLNTWTHIALVRSSGTVKVYVNGFSVLTQSTTPNTSSSRVLYIGGITNVWFNGYVDDLRVTKHARSTSNFTPPAALPDTPATDPYFAQTSLLLHMDGANGSTVFTDSSNNIGTGITQGGRSLAQPVASGTVVGVIGNYDGTHTAGNYLVRTSSSAANVSGVMTQTASTPATGTASIGRLTNATAYFNSQIYELVVLPRQSNGTEDQAWKDYTTAKWGITWS